MPWIVMTSSARMPTGVKAPYRNVSLVHISDEYAAAGMLPKMISDRARGVVTPPNRPRAIIEYGKHHVGKTERGGYQRALVEAEARAKKLNEERAAYDATVDESVF